MAGVEVGDEVTQGFAPARRSVIGVAISEMQASAGGRKVNGKCTAINVHAIVRALEEEAAEHIGGCRGTLTAAMDRLMNMQV